MGSGDKRDDGALGGEKRRRSPSGTEPNVGGFHEGPLPVNGRWSTRRKAEVYRLGEWRDKALFGMEAGRRVAIANGIGNLWGVVVRKVRVFEDVDPAQSWDDAYNGLFDVYGSPMPFWNIPQVAREVAQANFRPIGRGDLA
jgi:hypothetical protein